MRLSFETPDASERDYGFQHQSRPRKTKAGNHQLTSIRLELDDEGRITEIGSDFLSRFRSVLVSPRISTNHNHAPKPAERCPDASMERSP